MSARTAPLSPLASRKQRLSAESASSRARLAEQWRTMAHEAGVLARGAATVGAGAASAALWLVAALRRRPRSIRGARFTWLPMSLTGVRLALAIWRGFQARRAGPL